MIVLGLATMGASALPLPRRRAGRRHRGGTPEPDQERRRIPAARHRRVPGDRRRRDGEVDAVAVYWRPGGRDARPRHAGQGVALARGAAAIGAARPGALVSRETTDATIPRPAAAGRTCSGCGGSCARPSAPAAADRLLRPPPDPPALRRGAARLARLPVAELRRRRRGGRDGAVARRGRAAHRPQAHPLAELAGAFLQLFTGYLGFRMLEGEYKMMGLAPYGAPRPEGPDPRAGAAAGAGRRLPARHRARRLPPRAGGDFPAEMAALVGPPRAPDETPTEGHLRWPPASRRPSRRRSGICSPGRRRGARRSTGWRSRAAARSTSPRTAASCRRACSLRSSCRPPPTTAAARSARRWPIWRRSGCRGRQRGEPLLGPAFTDAEIAAAFARLGLPAPSRVTRTR